MPRASFRLGKGRRRHRLFGLGHHGRLKRSWAPTVGEKIGKNHLKPTLSSASLGNHAMATIGAADYFGLPVSTTHVLSSCVAGTRAANHSGLAMGHRFAPALAWSLPRACSHDAVPASLFWTSATLLAFVILGRSNAAP